MLARSKGGALSPSLAAQETGARDQILEVVPFCLVPAALFGTQSGAELACATHGIDYFRCCRTVLGMGWRVHGSVKPGLCYIGTNSAVNLVAWSVQGQPRPQFDPNEASSARPAVEAHSISPIQAAAYSSVNSTTAVP